MTKIEAQRIDRLDNHFSLYKDDMVDVIKSVRNIENALIGSNYNGNKGIVILLDEVNERVKALEDKQILADDKLDTLKWFQRGLIGIIFAYITWLLTK
jgi:hypothetical protein